MPLVARITFVVLVLATFAAFFVAQRLKSEPPVIEVPQITRSFSPNGDGKRDVSRIAVVVKVEPMQRALSELQANAWFAGLRRQQSRSRASIDFAERRNGHWKFHPLADWTDRDIGEYLARQGLPYHPLWQHGYVSIGDHHTSHRWQPGMDAEDTRFFGLKRECGLHGIA